MDGGSGATVDIVALIFEVVGLQDATQNVVGRHPFDFVGSVVVCGEILYKRSGNTSFGGRSPTWAVLLFV